MVNVSSNSEKDQQQRKRASFTAFEKAKATHLSRQLHLRLQYARLKVEHGWQRQTLNEVENLYFRHTRQPRQEPVAALEYHEVQLTNKSQPLTPTSHSSSDLRPALEDKFPSSPVDGEDGSKVLAATPRASSKESPASKHSNTSVFQTPTSHPPTPAAASSPVPLTTASPSLSHPISRHSSSTTQSSIPSAPLSNPNLTYDSFWSSHSSSSLHYRTRLANSSLNPTSSSPQSQTPSSYQNANSMTTFSPSFQHTRPPFQYTPMGSFDHSELAFAKHASENNATAQVTCLAAINRR